MCGLQEIHEPQILLLNILNWLVMVKLLECMHQLLKTSTNNNINEMLNKFTIPQDWPVGKYHSEMRLIMFCCYKLYLSNRKELTASLSFNENNIVLWLMFLKVTRRFHPFYDNALSKAENKPRVANYYTTLFIASQLTGKATGLKITRLSLGCLLHCFSQMSWVCFFVCLFWWR